MMGKCWHCMRWFKIRNNRVRNNPFRTCSAECRRARRTAVQKERRRLRLAPRLIQAPLLEVKRVGRLEREAERGRKLKPLLEKSLAQLRKLMAVAPKKKRAGIAKEIERLERKQSE